VVCAKLQFMNAIGKILGTPHIFSLAIVTSLHWFVRKSVSKYASNNKKQMPRTDF